MLGSIAPLGISWSLKSILLTLLLSGGCTYGSYSERYPFQSGFDGGVSPSFWTQKVLITGWGFTMATPYGPFNIGYLQWQRNIDQPKTCLLYTSPSPRDRQKSRMPSSA